ncbi:MAG: Gfo/Idh/MocA family oxidoreductase [Polyangia bacterium]|jgi:predicted dehydrogenase
MNVGIVGCGLTGRKRAQSLGAGKLVACSDAVLDRAQAVAAEHGAQAVADWREMVTRPEVQMVVVATTHDGLAPVTLAAVEAGKHVLVEKPAARRASELAAVIEAARSRGVLVRVGFNHRYHPALRKAHEMFVAGAVGPLMYLRARYGHGGRVGYQKEWRARPEVSGGGELIDQGMHLIDLARWFAGEFVQVDGLAGNWFWDMPVEDNAFLLLRTAEKKVAFMHCSCSEWKNLFSFEVFGRDGKLEVQGLGGSYGVERLTHYRMLPEMGPPETTSWDYPRADDSWAAELADFYQDVALGRSPAPGLSDAAAALRVVERIYEVSRS